MEGELEKFPVLRFTKEDKSNTEVAVATEFLFTIFLNDQELATLLCSPGNLQYLAVGFLASIGLLNSKDEIKKMEVDDWLGTVHVEIEGVNKAEDSFFNTRLIASGCGGAATFYSVADAATPGIIPVGLGCRVRALATDKSDAACQRGCAKGDHAAGSLCVQRPATGHTKPRTNHRGDHRFPCRRRFVREHDATHTTVAQHAVHLSKCERHSVFVELLVLAFA